MQKNIPADFTEPTALPKADRAEAWQEANRSFWEEHPMRYDWTDNLAPSEFSEDFYKEIDKRFFGNAREYFPGRGTPFASLMDFGALPHEDVLEIGVGNGSHAGLLAPRARSFTGIDLTSYAAKSTGERFRKFHLPGKILQMDAEHLGFDDSSFDFVWSWGVIHHSSNTESILREIARVLRPGGRATIMVYHRGWWNYYLAGFFWNLAKGKWRNSIHAAIQNLTDGAVARYYTPGEWRALCGKYFKVERVFVLGPKYDAILLPGGRLKSAVSRLLPNRLNNFLTRYCRMGSFLICELKKT